MVWLSDLCCCSDFCAIVFFVFDYFVTQAIEAAKVDKTDKPFNEMKIISIDIS